MGLVIIIYEAINARLHPKSHFFGGKPEINPLSILQMLFFWCENLYKTLQGGQAIHWSIATCFSKDVQGIYFVGLTDMTSCGNSRPNKNGSKTEVIQEKHRDPQKDLWDFSENPGWTVSSGEPTHHPRYEKNCFTVWKKSMVCELDSETDLVEPFF